MTFESATRAGMDSIIDNRSRNDHPRRGRPSTRNPPEVVGLVNAAIAQGATISAATLSIAEYAVIGKKGEHKWDHLKRVRAEAKNLERRYREYRRDLLRLWSDDPSGYGRPFAPMIFMGRPLPKPLMLRIKYMPSHGRPKKTAESLSSVF